MVVEVSKEIFDEVKAGRMNSVTASEDWTPEKGMIFIQHGEDVVVADFIESIYESQGKWIIVFQPLLVDLPAVPIPSEEPRIEQKVEDVPKEDSPKISEKPKRDPRKFLRSITKPWHGYYVNKGE